VPSCDPPFVASVSLWESSEAATDYAFSGHQAGHPEAVAAGRAKPFHHQEAFIRLAIGEIRGSLTGRNPLPPDAIHV
jgi:heme-degrading monooxygenase HmoA